MAGIEIVQRLRTYRHVTRLRSSSVLDPGELRSVVEALTALGPDAIGPMLECLPHGVAREPAIAVLKALVAPGTLHRFIEALASPNPAVVSGVTRVLAETEDYDPNRLLDALFRTGVSKKALESILQARAEALSAGEIAVRLGPADRLTRVLLLRLLERRSDTDAVRHLVPLLRSDDWAIRLFAVRILGGAGDPDLGGLVEPLLADPNGEVRLQAVASLHRLGARSALPGLVRTLRDQDLKVQSAAIDAVNELGDATTVPLLLDVLKDESEYARRAAVEVLNRIATTDAVQDLVRALHDEDWWVRARAADALGSLGGERVVDAVTGLLDEEDDFVRRYAVEILNTVTGESAVPALVRALNDRDWWVRERSIDALGAVRDPRAVEPLLKLLVEEPALAHLCAHALAEIGDRRAIEPLEDLQKCGDAAARREAEAALHRLRRSPVPGTPRRDDLSPAARHGRVSPPPSSAGRSPGGRSGAPASDEHSGARRRTPDAGGCGDRTVVEARPVRTPEDPRDAAPPPAPSVVVPVSFHNLEPGTVLLDRYRVLRRIGKGGFGAVYLVDDIAVQESIILKILNPQMSADDLAVKRFAQELKLTRRIAHPNVIRLYDFLELGGIHAVSMEYFPSRNLDQIVRREGAQPLGRTLGLIGQVCHGLAAAHDLGVVHRDMKPANLLVSESDEIKIVDFGLAWTEQTRDTRLTRSGILMGTPEYMSPEQIRGEPVDSRADLYSVGVILYELLCGRPPFEGETPVKILLQHLGGGAPRLADRVAGLPAEVAQLVDELMATEREKRPFSAGDLAEEIEDLKRRFCSGGDDHAADRRVS